MNYFGEDIKELMYSLFLGEVDWPVDEIITDRVQFRVEDTCIGGTMIIQLLEEADE